MNPEQAKTSVRWFVATFGGALAGYFAAWSGWFSAGQIIGALNSEAFLSIAASIVMLVWGLITHTQKNAIAVVDTMAKDPESPVKGVVLTNTIAGFDIAKAIPGSTTVVAGTPDAKAIATPGAV